MTEAHTGVALATRIKSKIEKFQLTNKVLQIVTDNARNFIKAFSLDDDDDDVTRNESDENGFEYLEIDEHLDSTDQTMPLLPKHRRCAAHLFNLVISVDVPKNITNAIYKKMLESASSKCINLFKNQNQSRKAADLIKSKFNRYFETPCPTRWNSWYDCLKVFIHLMESNSMGMNEIFDALSLPKLDEYEKSFLKEYLLVSILHDSILIHCNKCSYLSGLSGCGRCIGSPSRAKLYVHGNVLPNNNSDKK